MSESPDDDAKALTRTAATAMLEMFSRQQEAILGEHSAMGRWLTASLLAINGAAALAVFNEAERLSRSTVDAGPFVAGILAALISGVLNQRANQVGGRVLGEATGRAFVVAQTGEYTAEDQEAAEQLEPAMRKAGRWPILAGWISAGLFATGAIVTGSDSAPVDVCALRRCEALQTDMLSSRPWRADSPELFQALGCKAQGSGNVYRPHGAEAERAMKDAGLID